MRTPNELFKNSNSLSFQENALASLSQKHRLNVDILNTIYKNLDPLETALCELAKFFKNDLKFDQETNTYTLNNSSLYEIDSQTLSINYTQATFEITNGENVKVITRLPNGEITNTKTLPIVEFIDKTKKALFAQEDIKEIFDEVKEINPSLELSFDQTNKISRHDSLNISYLDSLHNEINIMHRDNGQNKLLLRIFYPNKRYSLRPFRNYLNQQQFDTEINRIKEINHLTDLTVDLLKEKYGDKLDISQNFNEENPFLKDIAIKLPDEMVITIKNGEVQIKNPKDPRLEETKPLKIFLAELSKKPSTDIKPTALEIGQQTRNQQPVSKG
jgi:hypothetical protein